MIRPDVHGTQVHQRVHVRCGSPWWRIPAGDVPPGKDARTERLNAQWAGGRLDSRLRGQQPLEE